MRIALAVEGTRGDVHPMLALGARLRELGHSVLVCAPPDFEDVCAARDLDFWRVGESVREVLSRRARAIVGGPLAMWREGQRYARAAVGAQHRELALALRSVDRVFAAGVQMGAVSAAELYGIPYRYVAYCPVLFPSREHAPFTLTRQDLKPWQNRLAWRICEGLFERALGPLVRRHREDLGLEGRPGVLDLMLGDAPILAADAGLAPLPSDIHRRVESLPCLHPAEPGSLPEKLEAFVEAGAPPVYLGFGSMTDPEPERTTRCLLEAVRSAGCRAVISRGWAELGDAALPDDVFVTGPVSHPALFPRMAAIVHHGGAGTTTSAARAGVPQVVVPHVLDQFYWAERIRRLGVGALSLARRRLEAGPLAERLRSLADNDVVQERARELGVRLRVEAAVPVDWSGLLELPAPSAPSTRDARIASTSS